jgi:hypothetical protein
VNRVNPVKAEGTQEVPSRSQNRPMNQPIDSSVAALLTAGEVAEILRVSPKWIYDHADGRRRPKLPCYEISDGGRKIRRFSHKQIKEFLSQCERLMNR